MPENNDGPVFRASKRRKTIRKRLGDDDYDAAAPEGATPANDDDEDAPATADRGSTALKQRRTVGPRKGGVAFSSADARRHASTAQETSIAPAPQSAVENAQARFVAPTGHIASADDKHMMAYIDSKLARLHPAARTSQTSPPDTRAPHPVPVELTARTAYTAHTTYMHSTAGGDLQEVDLGPSAAAPNTSTPRTRPVRLDRNGKPIRPRKNHNRRNSADLARDAMVEQILRESRLDIYQSPPDSAAPAKNRAGQNEDADERMAEEFKRNFYAAAEAKHVRKPAPAPPGAKTDSIRGPKLGGSRSQRAAMHAFEKAKTKK